MGEFRAFSGRVRADCEQPAIVVPRKFHIARKLGRPARSVQAVEPIRRTLENDLVLQPCLVALARLSADERRVGLMMLTRYSQVATGDNLDSLLPFLGTPVCGGRRFAIIATGWPHRVDGE